MNKDNKYLNSSMNINSNYSDDIIFEENKSFCSYKCEIMRQIFKIDFVNEKIYIKCDSHNSKEEMPINVYINNNLLNNCSKCFCNICNYKFNDNFIKYCIDCKILLCNKCYVKHLMVKENKNKHHYIINKKEMNNKCFIHLGEKNQYYCLDCKKNLCIKCTMNIDHIIYRHHIISFINIIPKKFELDYINNNKNINKSPLLSKLNDILINEYNENCRNYYYIKKMFNYINIIKKQYEKIFPEFSLIKFNRKYRISLSINDKEIKSNHSRKTIDDFWFNLFSQINFSQLKYLNFSGNRITDIYPLINLNLSELENLILFYNYIKDINIFSLINLINLKKLDLSSNEISNIDVMENMNCYNLQKLLLSTNNINNILVLSKVHFENLKELHLSNNKIQNIDVLDKVFFPQINYLDLSNNNIENINILKKTFFPSLECLNLSKNKINDISVLTMVKYTQLSVIYLYLNKISDISPIINMHFPKLINLDLSYNKIKDIKILEKIIIEDNFNNDFMVNLNDNQINYDLKKNMDIVNNLKFIKSIINIIN